MKIALALHGQPRFFEICYQHFFSNIIENFDCDIYFHTWWSQKLINTIYPCSNHAKNTLTDEDLQITKDIPDKLIKIYQPVDFLFEDYSIFQKNPTLWNNPQYYSQWAVKDLIVESKIKYDLVIRSRFDLMCTQDLTFVYDDSLWVASCCPYTDGRFQDMFSISNQKVFEKISDTYLNLSEFSKYGEGHDKMEWALYHQAQKENIAVKKFKADYESFDVLRSDTAKYFL
jgi:hypothetical protein